MPQPSDASELAASFLHLIQRFVGNQPDALAQMREQVQNELSSAKEMVARAEAQLVAIDQLQDLIDEAPDEVPVVKVVKPVNAPPLRKAILQVLRDFPGGIATRDDLFLELMRRGWGPGGKNPRNTFVSRLSEMIGDGVLVRSGNGVAIPDGQIFRQEEAAAM